MVISHTAWLLIAILGLVWFTGMLHALGDGRNLLAFAALIAGLLLLAVLVAIWGYGLWLPTWIPLTLGGLTAFWLVCLLIAVPLEERGISQGIQLPDMDGAVDRGPYEGGIIEHTLKW